MRIYLLLLCILILLRYMCVRGYHIECNFSKHSDVGIISGISGIKEFIDFLNRCSDTKK